MINGVRFLIRLLPVPILHPSRQPDEQRRHHRAHFNSAKALVGCLPGGSSRQYRRFPVIFAGMSRGGRRRCGGLRRHINEIKAMRARQLESGASAVGTPPPHSDIGPIIPALAADGDLRRRRAPPSGSLFAAGFIPRPVMAPRAEWYTWWRSTPVDSKYPRDQAFPVHHSGPQFHSMPFLRCSPVDHRRQASCRARFTPTEASIAACV